MTAIAFWLRGHLDRALPAARALVASPPALALAVALLLGLQLAIQGAVFSAFPRDEIESIFWGQGWALGYDIQQPPLHNWIAGLTTAVLGVTPLAFALIRMGTIALMLLFVWLGTRAAAGGDRFAAGLAVLGLLASVMFGLQIFLNLTHTLTLLGAVAFCFWTLTRVARPEAGLGAYLLVGLGLGVGALAKYSFALVALGLLIGALTHPILRRRLIDWRTLAALAVAGLIVAPHGLWLRGADHTVLAEMPELLHAAPLPPLQRAWDILRTGWIDPLAGVIVPLALLALCLPGFVKPGQPPAETDPSRPWRRLLVVAVVTTLALVTLVTLAAGGNRLRDHYLMPAALLLPIWAALRATALPRGAPAEGRAAFGLCAAAALLAAGLALAMTVIRPLTCDRCLTDLPVDRWEQAVREAGFDGGTLVSGSLDNAAALFTRFPGSRLLWRAPGVPLRGDGAITQGEGCLIVLDPKRPEADRQSLEGWLAEHLEAPPPPAPPPLLQAEGRLRSLFGNRTQTLYFVVYPQGIGQCR
ncbi:glycosyl transferase [Rhodospirillum rubrum]|uniref:glycosyltransferase family 39 protein n=1 Tax=Rhodospirillum rubrum TaxID=1085 RepID=UPI001906205C|nr:glycosyltransferase family 39 protein [Rhodospirillum rubrum]MBK1663652.1 glycosyl transferase [Rhodospirillum rubrum]MBK1675970.1 glycosyl transferase [Rhodospirillum rubrum]